MMQCKNKDCQLPRNLDQRLKRWAEYFQEILNESEQHNTTEFQGWRLETDQAMREEYPQPVDEEIH